ncbi:MAG: glutamate-5-semialdehyde dehydrogenase [Nitrospirota bacterium]
MDELVAHITEKARAAKRAAAALVVLSSDVKNRALRGMADALVAHRAEILDANGRDVETARGEGRPQAFVDRLSLTPQRIDDMARGVREVADLPDPVGAISSLVVRPNGMQVGRMRVPLGVIGIIYESRPNVTADSAALCLKSGNAVLLRGGSESLQSNRTIARLLTDAAAKAGVPDGAVSLIERTEREGVRVMATLDQYVDLIIPRGGEGLIRAVAGQATVPVIKHDKGVCHIYVDAPVDLAMAEAVCLNAKAQRPGTCNALETLLVHHAHAGSWLPAFVERLRRAGVEVRGCPRTLAASPGAVAATEEDWSAEYLDLILAVKVVDGMDDAMAHIARYGSQHTEAILTADYSRAQRFLREVDAAAVLINASTRLHDGYQFGLGAEIGISTSRLHARGAMGLEELTCAKFVVFGSGQIRT